MHIGKISTTDGHRRCQGGPLIHQGASWDNMLVDHQTTITLDKVNILSTNMGIMDQDRGVHLKCPLHQKHCATKYVGTYLWNPTESTSCDFAITQNRIQGIKVTDEFTKEEVLMSTDGHLLRLILKDALIGCGETIYATNYRQLFVHFLLSRRATNFTREIHPGEVDIITYATNQDDYVYHHILDVIREEFNAILQRECISYINDNKARLQRPDIQAEAFQLYPLGNGTFSVDAGETSYLFKCSSVVVKAYEAAVCYTTLPVLLQDLEGKPPARRFMEPISRKLSNTGTSIPCQDLFQSKYLDIKNQWIVANPALEITTAPKETHRSRPNHFTPDNENLDFSTEGIYSEANLIQFQNYMEYSRRRSTLT
jgi:hypothetical protein